VINFLFWNFRPRLSVKHPESILARTVLSLGIDLVILAENTAPPENILIELNREDSTYEYAADPNERFAVFTRFPGEFLEPFEDHPRMSIRRLHLPMKKDILVAIIHFPDRRNYSRSDQQSLSFELAALLHEAEARAGHRRTILVGDFNMNPFEAGMVDAKGFGAMMTRDLARRISSGGPVSRTRFYNPMWARFGDLKEGPPGTFYHSRANPTNIYWHMLDQVLVRPELIDSFINESLRVLTKVDSRDGELDLLEKKRKHWKVAVSDHLPIVFSMDFPEEISYERPAGRLLADSPG
jgi:endonuclease/exonuclease/phosphatase family protein